MDSKHTSCTAQRLSPSLQSEPLQSESLRSEPLQSKEEELLPLPVRIDIYVAPHCPNCRYAHEVAEEIRQHFPRVHLRLIDMTTTTEPIPDAVFATPTYLLNGRLWSLGNPSPAKVHETLTAFGDSGLREPEAQ